MSHLYIIMKLIDGIFKSFLFELLTNIVYKPRETDQKSNKEKVFSLSGNEPVHKIALVPITYA